MEGKRGRRHLECTGGAKSVTEHALAGRHGDAFGIRAENVSQRCRLRSIVLRRSGAMRVNIVDIIRIFSRVLRAS